MASIALPDAHVFAALLAPLYQLGASLSLAAVPAAACCLARDPGCPRHAALSPLVFGGVFVVDVALFGASVRFRPILGVVLAVAEMVAVLIFFVGRRERLDRVTWLGGDSATRAVVLYAVLWAPAAAAVVVLLPEATRLLARRCYRGGGDGAVPDGALPEEV